MNAEQLLQNFDRIAESPGSIAHLRRFILDLAVRGKLVEQDPNDEPASELLKQIQVEKEILVKEGKIKKQDPLPSVTREKQHFSPPSGWHWVQLVNISHKIHYGFSASANTNIKNVRLLRITDIQDNSVNWDSVPGCEIADDQVEQFKLESGDMLIARTGGTVGKSFLVSKIPVTAVFASYLIRVQCFSCLYDRYMKLFIESPVYWRQLEDGTRGTGQPNVNAQTLGRIAVILPPLAEQHRIVAKVDELMGLCDRLEAAQKDRESQRDQLVASSLHYLNQATEKEEFRDRAQFYFDRLPKLTTRSKHIKQLRQNILNLAVYGKLVPQDPNDEPASELLKRIQMEKKELIAHGRIRKEKALLPLTISNIPFTIPLSWEWVKIGIASLFTEYGTSQQSAHSEFGVPVLKMGDIQDNR